ncbi:MAG: preprotein translocase subunit SecE [Lachnospiraceae bacterium]|nr:preprotein translocase subunit SecE [Lachnospiraceae bacterium]
MADNAGKKKFLANFFKSLKAEWKKISWPNTSQIVKQTGAVVVISAILCGFIRLIDVIGQLLVGFVSTIFG